MTQAVVDRLRAIRKRSGARQEDIAERAGMALSSYQRYETSGERGFKGRYLKAEIAERLAEAFAQFGVERSEILALAGIVPAPSPRNEWPSANDLPPVSFAGQAPDETTWPRDIPVFGTAAAGADGDEAMLIDEATVGYVRRAPAMAGVRDAYAIYVVGDSMAPRYKEGAVVILNPHRPAQPGDDVLVRVRRPDGALEASIYELVSKTNQEAVVRQYNPERTITLSTPEIDAVHRITPPNELLSF